MNLVTGGGGFIGSHIVSQLLRRGEPVCVLDLNPRPPLPDGPPDGAPDKAPDGVKVVRGSVNDAEAVAMAMAGCRRVFHVAGNPQLWDRDRHTFAAVHGAGTRTVLAAAERAGVERVVHTSSATVLAAASSAAETSEPLAAAAAEAGGLGAYVRSKLEAEAEVCAALARGVPVVTVRPTLPIGPGDHRMTPPTRMLADFLSGRTPAYLESELNLIDVRDVACGHLLAAERGEIGAAYLLGNETMALSSLLFMLEELTGIPMPRRRVPYALAVTAAAISEFVSNHVSGRLPVAPMAGVRLARRLKLPDPSGDAAALGLECRPIKTALADAVAWLAENGFVDAERLARSNQS